MTVQGRGANTRDEAEVPATGGRVPLDFEEPTGTSRRAWPVTEGFPFPKGALNSVGQIRIVEEDGRALACQVRPLAEWPDGSLRWVLLDFQTDIVAGENKRLYLEYGPDVSPPAPERAIRIEETEKTVTVDTGPLQVKIERGFLSQVVLDGEPMVAEGEPIGPWLMGEDGKRFRATGDPDCEVAVEASGPLRAVIRMAGRHTADDGEQVFGFIVRVTLWAGRSDLQVEYTFVNDADAEVTELQEIGVDLPLRLGSERVGTYGAYDSVQQVKEDFHLVQDKPVMRSRSIFSEPRAADGEPLAGRGQGWVDLSDGVRGVTASLQTFGQNYPKVAAVEGDTIGFRLWPAEGGILKFVQGMAKTHRLYYHFHAGDGAAAQANEAAVNFEEPLLFASPEWVLGSGAPGEVFPCMPDRYPGIERAFRDAYVHYAYDNLAFGMIDYGDFPQLGTEGRERYMGNNEHDLAHGLLLQFARTGDRMYFISADASVWHTMDIDTIHHTTDSPEVLGGQRAHGDDHGKAAIYPSHMWSEGLVEYYWMTGHPRALEIVRGLGDCYLRMVELGRSLRGDREGGWSLIALTAIYEATGDERYLEGCRKIVHAVQGQQREDGGWLIKVGFRQAISPMHVCILLAGLRKVHELTGDESVRETFLKGMDWVYAKGRFPDGTLRYIDHPDPAFRRSRYGGDLREAFGYAYHLTGDPKYIEMGLVNNKWAFGVDCLRGSWMFGITQDLRLVMVFGSNLASEYRGNFRFLYWADRAGLLKDLPE